MTPTPIATQRLDLVPLGPEHATLLRPLAGSRRIADTTISVPHPFTDADATVWVEHSTADWVSGRAARFLVFGRDAERPVGHIALVAIDTEHQEAELSFWLGDGFEGRGYITEAATAIITFGFDTLGLNRICAHHMVRNAASQKVLARLGFREEGLLRERVRKWGVFEDVKLWSRLRSDPAPRAQ